MESMKEELKNSAQVAKETGLSVSRVNQFARAVNLDRIGSYFVWTQEDIDRLRSRMGRRDRRE